MCKVFIAFCGLIIVMIAAGCGTTSVMNETPQTEKVRATVFTDLNYPIDIYDPWEGYNRRMYNFNAKFDRYVFIPVVNAYEAVLPDPVEDGISNFFSNLGEIISLINSILQFNGDGIVTSVSRLGINSTLGFFGFFDPATHMGITRQKEDFGQTLAVWGATSGPYLVLPILGPSSVRDTAGLVTDFWINDEIDLLDYKDDKNKEIKIKLLQAIDARHRVDFRYLQGGTPFEYEGIRYLYIKKRELDALN